MPALVYAEILAGCALEQFLPRRWHKAAVTVYLVIVVTTFIYFSPWIYALALYNDGHERRRWLKRWN